MVRITYRVKQLLNALFATPSKEDLILVKEFLPPDLMNLFTSMQKSEQAHSIQVFIGLQSTGETNVDLLMAALLHDVGKTCNPVNIFERIIIVIATTIIPKKVGQWGQGKARGMKRAFVVACKHPAWGAELADAGGASEMTVRLIRRHQDTIQEFEDTSIISEEDQLLHRLQHLDNTT